MPAWVVIVIIVVVVGSRVEWIRDFFNRRREKR
jgi:hypothetical protein